MASLHVFINNANVLGGAQSASRASLEGTRDGGQGNRPFKMRGFLALTLFSAVVGGCTWQEAVQKIVPDEDAFARGYLDLIRKGDREQTRALLDPSGRDSVTEDAFMKVRGFLDRGAPQDVTLIGANVNTNLGTGIRKARLDYQIHDPSGFVWAVFVIRHSPNETVVENFHVEPLPGDLREINSFRLGQKGPVHYLMFLAFVAEIALIVYALVRCGMAPLRRRKWLWILFILFGFGKVWLNWTNGATDFQILSISLFGIGFSKAGPYAPWLLNISLPVGAVVFLLKRRSLLAAGPSRPPGPPESPLPPPADAANVEPPSV